MLLTESLMEQHDATAGTDIGEQAVWDKLGTTLQAMSQIRGEEG
jgi:hypothetical protein